MLKHGRMSAAATLERHDQNEGGSVLYSSVRLIFSALDCWAGAEFCHLGGG